MYQFPIIEKLGGNDLAYHGLKERGWTGSSDTIRMWRKRGQISSTGLVQLMHLAEAREVEYQANDFEPVTA